VEFFFVPDIIAQQCRNQRSIVKVGDCFGKDPRNDTGYDFDDTLCVVIASKAKQSFSYKQSVPPDKG